MDIQVDITDTTLETPRLLLRPWKQSDVDDFYEYASVYGVGEMAGWPHHETKSDSENILKMFIEEKNVFAIVYKENNKVIGSLGLHPSWGNSIEALSMLKQKEVGYVLSKDYWGRALMPEAVNRLIRYCFDELGMDMLTCDHFEENDQSRRVIEKCGFKLYMSDSYYSNQLKRSFDGKKYILLRNVM